MRKGSDHFKETIQEYLQKRAEEDPLFAKTLEKENKDIDSCIAYIIKTVKESGCVGFTDDEVFNMAVHYYDEDDIENAEPPSFDVVINHKPELNEDEKQELKERARKEVIQEEKARMRGKKPKAKKPTQEPEQLSLID